MTSAFTLSARAPAKINLSLHVLGRRDDGYHELESLVAFAGAGDGLLLRPDQPLTLRVSGPTAVASGQVDDNLVLKAARGLAGLIPGLRLGAFELVKRLPVAAGLGGGSADAAAALRLLASLNDLRHDDPRLFEVARATGADVSVCLDPRARIMRGVGERLEAALDVAPLAAVLVNPGVGLATRAVFARLGLHPGETRAPPGHGAIQAGQSSAALVTLLTRLRNDMEAAARDLEPAVQTCLAALAGTLQPRLVRMSGSGATCFALFDDCRAAGRAAKQLRRDHPAWWVKSTLLR